jgi:hypothetical protein
MARMRLWKVKSSGVSGKQPVLTAGYSANFFKLNATAPESAIGSG